MNPFELIILIITAAVSVTTLFLLIARLIDSILGRDAPYVSLDPLALPRIVKLMQLKSGNIVYDLGSGNGRVLIELARHQPKARYIGYDIGLLPTLHAKYNTWQAGQKDIISLRQGNLFDQNFSGADRVFTYLFPKLMDKLLPKLTSELKAGALLVSCDYPFLHKSPEKIVKLKRNTKERCHTLYLYKF